MARQARSKSRSGIYRIILRGINRQVIFEEDDDKQKFLECLGYYKNSCRFEIYRYCLMDNHAHLLIRENEEDIATIMKRMGVRYVGWYNRRYSRCGHLFQDRFKSEVVEDDAYLLVVLRYIHQNPLKAGLVKNVADYQWSSYHEYINIRQIVDIDFVLGMLSADRKQAINEFIKLSPKAVDEDCLEYEEHLKLKDEQVKSMIQQYAHVNNPIELQTIEKPRRDEVL